MSADSSLPPLFAGRVFHALDSKNRVTIPARWRKSEDGDEFFLMPDRTSTFLRAMPPEQFRAVAEKIETEPTLTPKDRVIFKRRFYSSSVQQFADKQGRLLIPAEFCAQLDLQGDIVLVGVEDVFEVWSKARWEKNLEAESATFDRVAEIAGL